MEVRQLEMLLAVVESGGYARAGERLHISHSAIHRQIKLLEDQVHDRILVRSGKRVVLTEAGCIIVATARRVRQEVSDAYHQISEARELQRGTLRIGTADTILFSYLLPILERFQKDFPKVEVYVKTTTAGDVFGQIQAEVFDLGIVFNAADILPKKLNLQYEVLYKEEFVWAVGDHHPLAKRASVSLNELASFPFAMLPEASHIRQICEQRLRSAGVTANISFELENEEAMEKVIKTNLAIALLPARRTRSNGIHRVRVRETPIGGEVSLVLPKREYLPRAVREFVGRCRKANQLRSQKVVVR
ncbi:MAG: LysR family transcriptional regulator [Acidobacteria bacterium]|nr:MAG: LysR family transcriptional regulator [Acidobacteriota bacterium]